MSPSPDNGPPQHSPSHPTQLNPNKPQEWPTDLLLSLRMNLTRACFFLYIVLLRDTSQPQEEINYYFYHFPLQIVLPLYFCGRKGFIEYTNGKCFTNRPQWRLLRWHPHRMTGQIISPWNCWSSPIPLARLLFYPAGVCPVPRPTSGVGRSGNRRGPGRPATCATRLSAVPAGKNSPSCHVPPSGTWCRVASPRSLPKGRNS